MEKLRVVEVAVKGLFGLYDHVIPLNDRSRVTIIHGPNGVGKTVLLKCLTAFFSGRYHVLRATPFTLFSVKMSDDTEVLIRQHEVKSERADRKSRITLSVEVHGKRIRTSRVELKNSADVIELARRVERENPWLIRVGEDLYFDNRVERHLSAEEVVDQYLDYTGSTRLSKLREAEPEVLRALRSRVKVRFVETSRLYKVEENPRVNERYVRRETGIANTVNEYASQLHGQVEAALAQYGRKSQQLDQSFPQRLIQEVVEPLPLEQLKAGLETLEIRHKQLSDIGLLDKIPTRPFDTRSLDDVAPYKLVPMTLYLTDNIEKISVFDSLAGRAQLLLDSANRKFRNKKLVINRDKGLSAIGIRGETLELDSLSSGEQHEIVLLYELLFSISPDTLVLIDEPELSLHVTWQKMFLPEILSVAAQVGFDVIIATHSPFVVGGRRDLMVALDAEPDDIEEIQRTEKNGAPLQ